MHQSLSAIRWAIGLALVALTACGGVAVKPELALPRALVQPLPAKAGLVLSAELRNFKHEETRAGAEWSVDLGPGQVKLMESMFGATFREVSSFGSLDEARAATGLQAIFLPTIEQYSFATANDTSGGYFATTIGYRIAVHTSDGQEADSLTLAGYGSARAKGGSGPSLIRSTNAAMRDAASKFIVQFPKQAVAARLKEGQAVLLTDRATPAIDAIALVPIDP